MEIREIIFPVKAKTSRGTFCLLCARLIIKYL